MSNERSVNPLKTSTNHTQTSAFNNVPLHLIDTHAYLQAEHFAADRDAVIQRTHAAGVAAIIWVSTDVPSNCARELLKL